MDCMERRRSVRTFKPDAVDPRWIDAIVRAAGLAPSAKNRQPWRYIAYTGDEKHRLLDVMERSLIKEEETHALLPESAHALPDAFNTLKFMRKAPVVIMVMNPNGRDPFAPVDADSRIAEICDSLSIGASVEHMLLKATELGLGACWIANTFFAYGDLCDFLGEKGQLLGAVALGYADEQPAPRPRKKLSDILEYR